MKNVRIVTAILLLTGLSILIAGPSSELPKKMKTALLSYAAYPLKAANAVSKKVRYIFEVPRLASLARALEKELSIAERGLAEMKELELENERLRGLLELRKRYKRPMIAASVIGRDSTGWQESIIIDKGSRDGIRRDMAVISYGGLVGRVYEVGDSASNVMLISDVNSKVSVILQDGRERALLTGRGRGRCGLKYISADISLGPGEKVITSGEGGVFPKGLLIGSVDEAHYAPGILYKEADVEPAQELSGIEEVLCLK